MATTNNVQRNEPYTTSLKRQVQTLATAVERLTKQNHDLEEQLRQKTRNLTLRRGTKKAPTLKEGTKKGLKVATPQAGQSDRTQAIYSP